MRLNAHHFLFLIEIVVSYPLSTSTFNETELRRQILAHYNFLRSLHDAPALIVDGDLDAAAADWARHLSTTTNDRLCLYHSRAGGENIYFQWSTDTITETELATAAMKTFYEEIRYYDYANPGLVLPAAHFTNLIWRNCEKIVLALTNAIWRDNHGGCNVIGSISRPARGYMLVIHQWPTSNVMTSEQFMLNVLPPRRIFTFA